MQIEHLKHDDFEQVVHFSDDAFQCYVALHNTNLGPAIGGCRLKPYLSTADALTDVLRLAKGMTYKSALAGLNFGGGKCVVIADHPTRDIMLKVGEVVNYFDGNYITAEDIGTTLLDTAVVGEITPYVVHFDGSVMTARGVLASMRAAADHLGEWGGIDGVPIWIQGLGKVGMDLAKRMRGYTNLYVTDLRPDLVMQAKAFGAYELGETDRRFIAIYAPCALGQVINPGNVHSLNYSIICGAANNQLADESYADVLHRNHVLLCPDFLTNAGGVINAAYELVHPYDEIACEAATDGLGERLVQVFKIAESEKLSPWAAAKMMAELRFRSFVAA